MKRTNRARARNSPPEKVVSASNRIGELGKYFRSIDWAVWWEEFYLSRTTGGRFTYRLTRDFIRTKTKNKLRIAFLQWYMGPPQPDPEAESPYPWCKLGPQDWHEKRRTGGWFTETNLKKWTVEIRRRMNAMEALRTAGNEITLNSLVRAEQLAREIDRSFGGVMFLDGLDLAENMVRAQSYISLHQSVLNMKAQAQELYAKSHGVNFDDMAGVVQLFQSAALTGSTADAGNSRSSAVLQSMVDLCLQKSGRMGLDLPAGAVEVISEASEKHDRKKGIQ